MLVWHGLQKKKKNTPSVKCYWHKDVIGLFLTNLTAYSSVVLLVMSFSCSRSITLLTMVLNQLAHYNSCCYFNPLNPKSDQHLNSSYSYTAELFMEIMRIKGDDHQGKKLWLFNKFSLSEPNEMWTWMKVILTVMCTT